MKKGIAAVIAAVVVLIVVIGLWAALMGDQGGNEDSDDQGGMPEASNAQEQLTVTIDYDGPWSASVAQSNDTAGNISTSSQSYNGTGHQEITLTKPAGANVWTVIVLASKLDDSNGIITARILDMNGDVLKEDSSSLPSGGVTLTYTNDGGRPK